MGFAAVVRDSLAADGSSFVRDQGLAFRRPDIASAIGARLAGPWAESCTLRAMLTGLTRINAPCRMSIDTEFESRRGVTPVTDRT